MTPSRTRHKERDLPARVHAQAGASANASPDRAVPHSSLNAYLIRTLRQQIRDMQRDLVECEHVRQRTRADIKHIRRQIATLRRRTLSHETRQNKAKPKTRLAHE